MQAFSYVAVTSEGEAIGAKRRGGGGEGGNGGRGGSAFVAGGTTLLDIMKLGVEEPGELVDINHVPLVGVEEAKGGGLRIGANVRNTELAYHPLVVERYRVLSEAILSGASPQLRNMATTGGNLMQRTRCYYYRDVSYPCNMREPGSGCSAMEGYNRIHAVLGTSEKCIATHPSDMCVALAALEAVVIVHGGAEATIGEGAERRIPFEEFYVAYGKDPARWNTLGEDELIVAVEIPALPMAKRGRYLKVRDRASYEFALASVAAMLEVEGGVVKDARVALGGVATMPWRSREAEGALVGKQAGREAFEAAAEAAMSGAVGRKYNAFKIELAKRTIVRGLEMVIGNW
ncbi:MAG TPA: xanthine dehydrogenase family protein subunit M [Phycisphaerae bacterium]|nr:xanthine dehydrogenase family protein subunit M [Phycisphaerae bacterium]